MTLSSSTPSRALYLIMDFDTLLWVDEYRDLDSDYPSDSDYDPDGPDLFEPPDLSALSSPNLQASLYNKPPSPTPLLPQPPLSKPTPLIRPNDKLPIPPKQTHRTVGARMQALTLFEHRGKNENGDKL
jgi:hypothetical protein